jgi:hypothetical protein
LLVSQHPLVLLRLHRACAGLPTGLWANPRVRPKCRWNGRCRRSRRLLLHVPGHSSDRPDLARLALADDGPSRGPRFRTAGNLLFFLRVPAQTPSRQVQLERRWRTLRHLRDGTSPVVSRTARTSPRIVGVARVSSADRLANQSGVHAKRSTVHSSGCNAPLRTAP